MRLVPYRHGALCRQPRLPRPRRLTVVSELAPPAMQAPAPARARARKARAATRAGTQKPEGTRATSAKGQGKEQTASPRAQAMAAPAAK